MYVCGGLLQSCEGCYRSQGWCGGYYGSVGATAQVWMVLLRCWGLVIYGHMGMLWRQGGAVELSEVLLR